MGLRLPFITCGAFILLGLVLMLVVPRATDASTPVAAVAPPIQVAVVERPSDEVVDRVVAGTLLDYDRAPAKVACAPAPVVAAPTPVAAPPVATPAPVGKPGEVGYVRVSTYPWGWAIVGDQKVETMAGKLTLPVGRHTITLTCGPECEVPRRTVRTVDVQANKTFPIKIVWDEDDE